MNNARQTLKDNGNPEILKSEILKSEILKSEILKSEILKSEILKSEIFKSEIFKSEILKSEIPKYQPIKNNKTQKRTKERTITMSKATLTSLLEFLYGTLSSEDKRWIGEQLLEQANTEEQKPYTIEELHERIAKAERDFAEGRYFTDDEVFADLDEYEKKEELQCAEAV